MPDETYPPLVIDADRMLAGAIALQGFEPIAWGRVGVLQLYSRIKD